MLQKRQESNYKNMKISFVKVGLRSLTLQYSSLLLPTAVFSTLLFLSAPTVYARPFCEGEDPPPICSGGPSRPPTPVPTQPPIQPPSNARQVIRVETQQHQVGGWITVTGEGFTPLKGISMYAVGLARRALPLSIGGPTYSDSNGRFRAVVDVRCWPGQSSGYTTIWAVDDITGTVSTGTTYAYTCR